MPAGGAADLSRMSRSAADLSRTAVPEKLRKRALESAEAELGMRCRGCGQRITTGFEFTALEPVMDSGGVKVITLKLSACNGDNGCDFAQQAREGATAVEMVEFVWLTEDPAPPAEEEPAAAAPAG